jgi:hypothetical protein
MSPCPRGAALPSTRNCWQRCWPELGKIGSNINQIAYHLNAGRPGDVTEGSIQAAITELLEWRTALMQSLGYERNRKPPEK